MAKTPQVAKAQTAPKADVLEETTPEEQVDVSEENVPEKEPETLKEIADAEKETNAEKASTDTEAEAVVDTERMFEALRKENEDLRRLLALSQKGKPLPPAKKERPAGMYRLTTPFWDGRVRHPAGKKMQFAEGQAPQSANFIE